MKHKWLWILLAVWLVLALVFAFTDLAISKRVANPQSQWAYWFQGYGQIPGIIVGLIGANILMWNNEPDKRITSILLWILFYLLNAVGGTLLWAELLGQQFHVEVNYLLAIALGNVTLTIIQIILHTTDETLLHKLVPFARMAVLLVLAANVTVWACKFAWGRWTYRDMLAEGDLSLYTPWYLPQGNNGHHSFYSGHTTLGFCLLPLILIFRKDSLWRTVTLVVAVVWGLLVAASRVTIGAHFMSDVLFGAGMTSLWFYGLQRWGVKGLPKYDGKL